MRYEVIASGSKGNALVLNDVVMIDCGVCYKKLAPYYLRLQLVLLTHIHSDHFCKTTITRLAKERPALRFGCPSWLVAPLVDCGVRKGQIDMLVIGIEYCYFGFTEIIAFQLEHDVPNCGYKISMKNAITSAIETVIYATDTCSLPNLPNCDYYFIEANYRNLDELADRMKAKIEAGQYVYEKRVSDWHLSEEYATDWIVRNGKPSSRYVFLHEHREKE